MRRITFKSICDTLAANETVKICTTFGWNICKSSEVKVDSKKKIIRIPAWSKWCGACDLPMRVKQILSIEKAA